VREVHLIQGEQPQIVMDISDTMELKLKAITRPASQVGDFEIVEARVRRRAAALGEATGYAYAEGFDRVVLPG
jgi:LmbE family N-acetylglucosaminyl deacetylase